MAKDNHWEDSKKYRELKARLTTLQRDLDEKIKESTRHLQPLRDEVAVVASLVKEAERKIEFRRLDRKFRGTYMSGDACFITTACIESLKLPDDCLELETLRFFRDNYLARIPNGKEEIREYYALAPSLVRVISERADGEVIYQEIYRSLITPAVYLIQQGEMHKAHQLYKNKVLSLKARLSSPPKFL